MLALDRSALFRLNTVSAAVLFSVVLAGCGASGGQGSGALTPPEEDPVVAPLPLPPDVPTDVPSDPVDAYLPAPGNPGSPAYPSRPITPGASVYETNPDLNLTGFQAVHAAGLTGEGVTVAVVDTGVAPHPALGDRLLAGIDLSGGSPDGRRDLDGHGTMMAGIIAASGDDGVMIGIAPGARIVPIRVFNDNLEATPASFKQGVLASEALSARIYNMSLGQMTSDEAFLETFRWLRDKDKLSVVASGNFGWAAPAWPAGYANLMDGYVIVVGAIDGSTRTRVDYSNAAGAIKNYFLVAPGLDITSTGTLGSYETASGTSQATAVVSGVAALVWSHWPYLQANEVSGILFDSAIDLGAPGVDDIYGHGLVSAERALAPLGELKTQTATGRRITYGQPLAVAPSGLRLREGASTNLVYFDAYRRAFHSSLSQAVATRGEGALRASTVAAVQGERYASVQTITDPRSGLRLDGYARTVGTGQRLGWRLSGGGASLFDGARFVPALWAALPSMNRVESAQGLSLAGTLPVGADWGASVVSARDFEGRDRLGLGLSAGRDAHLGRLSLQGAVDETDLGRGATLSARWDSPARGAWQAHAQINAEVRRAASLVGSMQTQTTSVSAGVQSSSLFKLGDRLEAGLRLDALSQRARAHWTLPTAVDAFGQPVFERVRVGFERSRLPVEVSLGYSPGSKPTEGAWNLGAVWRNAPQPEWAATVQYRLDF